MYPLIAASEDEVKAGRNPIFQSHMWDGSAVPLDENLEIAKQILPRMKAINAILEVEIGVVGGEEDGVSHDINEHLYTTLDDAIATVEALGLGEQGRYMAALTFGNVHGVYKPGNVKLKPELLKEIQDGLAAKYGTGAKPLDLVFHGGSGSTDAEIAEAVANGVVKMNIDTDTQYAFTRSVADYMLSNYEGVLKVDGERRQQEALRPARLGQGRRVGDGRPRRRVDPAARLRRAVDQRLGSGCRQHAGRPTSRRTGGRVPAASPAPRDERPRPQYGEYAPEGLDVAAAGGRARIRPGAAAARTQGAGERGSIGCHGARACGTAGARSIRRHRAARPLDRMLTIALLVIGVFGAWSTAVGLQDLPRQIQVLYSQEGIGQFVPRAEPAHDRDDRHGRAARDLRRHRGLLGAAVAAGPSRVLGAARRPRALVHRDDGAHRRHRPHATRPSWRTLGGDPGELGAAHEVGARLRCPVSGSLDGLSTMAVRAAASAGVRAADHRLDSRTATTRRDCCVGASPVTRTRGRVATRRASSAGARIRRCPRVA